jgi:hypothetical protein
MTSRAIFVRIGYSFVLPLHQDKISNSPLCFSSGSDIYFSSSSKSFRSWPFVSYRKLSSSSSWFCVRKFYWSWPIDSVPSPSPKSSRAVRSNVDFDGRGRAAPSSLQKKCSEVRKMFRESFQEMFREYKSGHPAIQEYKSYSAKKCSENHMCGQHN